MRRAIVIVLICLPAILALVKAASFYAANHNNGALISSGEMREYLLYVPRSYDASRPTPLVISMHGAGGWPVQQMTLTGWNRVAEKERLIVVYPAGAERGGPRVWHVEDPRDVRFISDLIDKIEASYNIDRRRIYANGFSNGGGMAFVLSSRLSDRIAAVGMVGAAQFLPFTWCKDRHAVAMIDFHGTADPDAPYNGGVTWLAPDLLANVPKFAEKWARRNGCSSQSESSVASDVTLREYSSCTDDATVALYTIRGGGHTWPGGEPLLESFVGRTTRSIDASSMMWAFFREHPLVRGNDARDQSRIVGQQP